jgi:hypothetical protein
MAHHIIKSGYIKLADRLNRFPQGAFLFMSRFFPGRTHFTYSIMKGRPRSLKPPHTSGSAPAMAAVIGVILKLSPIKQAMASQQMNSIYLEALFKRLNL